ncbi:MAG: quinolinate synthase NadA [Candidatus Micrarchaeota archaeon]
MAIDYAGEIRELAEEMKALILAHNYQRPEIQDVADFAGDSLDLCLRASEAGKDFDYILFCGVDFMAETANIITGKKVLIPDLRARCPMAGMLGAKSLREAKREHPGAGVVLYINTLAEAKAEANVICTSSNCVDVIGSLEQDEILFGPDMNLAWYAAQRSRKKIIPVPPDGHCIVHKLLIHEEDVLALKDAHPHAVVLAHPECNPAVQKLADHVLSTNGMLRKAKALPEKEFIVVTEEGLTYRMKKEMPEKNFYPIEHAVCVNMKRHTLEKAYLALKNKSPEVKVPEGIADRARGAIKRMLEIKPKM